MKIAMTKAAVTELERNEWETADEARKRAMSLLRDAARYYENACDRIAGVIKNMRDALDMLERRGDCLSNVTDLALDLAKWRKERDEQARLFRSLAYVLNLEIDEPEAA